MRFGQTAVCRYKKIINLNGKGLKASVVDKLERLKV
jgi:hypothetical protein